MRSTIAGGVLIGVIAVAALPALTGCEQRISQANYDKLANGMTIQEVEAILGPGERQEVGGMSISGAGVAGGAAINSQATYIWKGKDMTITVVCQGGKVASFYKQ